MKVLNKLIIFVLLIGGISACSEQANLKNKVTADINVIINADIVTMDSLMPAAQAIAYSEGKIIAIGSNEAVLAQVGADKSIQDAQGETIVPGFIETHDHFYLSSAIFLVTDIQPFTTPTLAGALEKMSTAKPDKDGWVLGFGADQTLYQEKMGPSRQDLDKLFPNDPVVIFHLSGHGGFVNSKALEISGIDKNTANPTGGYFEKDAQGELTGYLSGIPAVSMVRGFPDANEKSALLAAKQRAAAGVTTSSELALMNKKFLIELSELTQSGTFPMRIVAGYFSTAPDYKEMLPALKNHENSLLKIPFIKTWTDGSIQGGTGSLKDGYYQADFGSDGAQGSQEFFNQQILDMYQQGYWPAIHANGDNAVELALNAIEYAQQKLGENSKSIRPQIIHAQVTNKAQIQRMAVLGANPSFFITHVYYWGDLHYETTLGPEKSARLSALGDAFSAGIKASMHNDPPVSPVNPLLNMWIATQRKTTSGRILGAEQAITAEQAMLAYTVNAAYQFGMEKEVGSLTVGKNADFVFLSDNPLTIKASEIKDITVLKTVLAGVTTFELTTKASK